MAYTSGATVNQTTAISDITVALSGSPDIPDPIYCQRLNVLKGVNITNLTVSSGGWASSGSYISATVKSGGTLTLNGGTINGLTAESGAILGNLATGASYISGTWNIASGVRQLRWIGNSAYYYDIHTDDEGWIHGIIVTGAGTAQGLKLKDTLTSSYLYLHPGTIASGVSNFNDPNGLGTGTGGAVLVSSGATGLDIQLKSGTFLAICASGATFGGVNTTIENTQIRYIAYHATDNRYNYAFKDDNIAIRDGVITGMTLKTLNAASGNIGNTNSASWLHDIRLVSGITAVDPIISSGGTLYLSAGAAASGGEVQAYGSVFIYNGGYVSGMTISGGPSKDSIRMYASSGALIHDVNIQFGRLQMSQGAVLSGATVSGGCLDLYDPNTQTVNPTRPAIVVEDVDVSGDGRIFLRGVNASGANIRIHGGLSYIQNGAYVNGLTVYAGTMSAYTNNGTAVVDSGGKSFIENVAVSGGQLTVGYLTSGSDISVYGGRLFISSGSATGVTASGGHVEMSTSGYVKNAVIGSGASLTIWNNATLAGAGTVIESGATVKIGSFDCDVYTENGITHNLTVFSGRNINIRDGIRLDDAVVSSGGILNVALGGGAMVGISDITVEGGGKLYFDTGAAYITGMTVSSGATLSAGPNNQFIGSNINIAKGAWYGNTGVEVVDGVLYGSGNKLTGFGAFYFVSGFVVSNVIASNYLYLSAGAQIRDVAATTGAGVALCDGGYAYNVKVAADATGNFFIHNYAGTSGVALGGAGTDIAQGKIYQGAGNLTKPYTWYVENGVVKELKLVASDYEVRQMHLREGIKAEAPVVSSAGMLHVSSGAEAANARMFNAGGITVYDGGLVRDAVASGGYFYVSSGGELLNATVDGYAVISVGAGGHVSGATVDRGVYTGTNKAQIRVVGEGARADDVTVMSGAMYVSSGGYVSGATFTGNTGKQALRVTSGRIDDLVLSDALLPEETVDLYNGAVISGGVMSGVFKRNLIYMMGGSINDFDLQDGNIYQIGGGTITNLRESGGQMIARGSGAIVSGATVVKAGNATAAEFYAQNGASAFDVTAADGGKAYAYMASTLASGTDLNPTIFNATFLAGGTGYVHTGGFFRTITVAGGTVSATKGGTVSDATVTAGTLIVSSGAVIDGLTATGGNVNAVMSAVISNANITGTAKLDVSYNVNDHGAIVAGADTNIVAGGLLHHGADTGATITDGLVTGLGANGEYYRVQFGEGITVEAAKVNGGGRFYTYGDAKVYDLAVIGSSTTASVVAYDDSEYYDTVLTKVNADAQLNLRGNNKAYNTIVGSGTRIRVDGTATATDTTLMAGATMEIQTDTAVVDGKLTLDYTGAAAKTLTIDWLNRVAATTPVVVKGVGEAGTYGITTSGGTLAKIACANGLYSDEVAAGASYTNGISGLTYSFDGTTLTAVDAGIAATAAAASLADATTINGADKAAKWTANTTYSANVFLADGLTTGNAWLDIDGFANTAANLYGAAKNQNFAGVVNIGADNGTIKNLAAGAGLGGSVAGVKLTVGKDMNVTGAVYAGGMGGVTGKTETLVEGGSFAGNVFAGALCNRAANNQTTATGDIALTVDGGTFAGNIYAGAAVKAGAATTVVHTAGDITVELSGGVATKQAFCVYGGGYATGTVEDATVYEAGDVDITVTGGEWGAYASGRGIFGGVYADKVAASVESVDITVAGGTMGNVYGGGWAQNGGSSTVGDVTITIAGDAEVSNVFGGGSYSSTSGGTTEVGAVSILVAGGSIAGNIFAGGQNEFSTVTDDISVTFTGSNGYDCNVYGYGVQASATSGGDKALSFVGYTGTLSGNIGGFDAIAFEGDTAATLSGAAIDNDEWTFDYTGRTLGEDTAMLTLDGGSFTGDTVAVDLSAAEQAASGWSIAAGLTAADATFGVELSTGSAANLGLGDTLGDAYGIYEGWGFTLEDSTLKFKQLA